MTDYEKILQPISENSPTGVDIRKDNNENFQLYLRLKDHRSNIINEEDDKFENNQALVVDTNSWQEIIASSENLLASYSKDLEIAIWLLEGLTRLKGFQGLNIGLKIICYLLEKHEHEVHPQKSTEESMEIQLAAISMLSGKYENGSIIVPIYFSPFLSTTSGDLYHLWSLKKILESNNKVKNNYKVTKEIVLQSAELMSIVSLLTEEEFLISKLEISSCVENINILSKIINNNFGAQAPNLKNLINVINYCFNLVNVISAIIEEKKNLSSLTTVVEQKHNEGDNKNHQSLVISTQIPDKVAAIEALANLVKFFRKNEPHSPVSYILERALGWCNLSLPEVICEMMSDEARAEFCKISGVPFIDTRSDYQQEDEEERI
ncbi:ImpA-like N-terminal type VI secretion system protein (plasmid) [Candidatus Trichorickettsia mobilis]|uniref:type VI secretion system protein TssA n=1 Tax=Candidatus Trichorickettsia mobilis TaxID=1346319 RepID=UPI002B2630DB|nr:type VI secretion system protein TssA [Candidatus Trichorickettsia mobilis]WPY01681.1 ImpA-like N-terminal type VI secretion system protein [Candidatus Trichorickettsia mobilis]